MMSVNLSPRQLVTGEIIDTVSELLTAVDLPPDCLCLEITESTVAVNSVACAETLEGLKRIGVRLSLDDFGTGQSTLATLGNYPFDMLKIDQSFIARVDSDEKGRRIFACAVGLAQALGLTAVTEGIETPEQLAFSVSVGCDIAQGYFISEPYPAEIITPMLTGGFDHAIPRAFL